MRLKSRLIIFISTVMVLVGILAIPAGAEDYPGVFTDSNTLLFVQNDDDFGTLEGVVILTYEYSMDWIITSARLGVFTGTGILITDGNQYVYNADGTRRSVSQFNSMEMSIDVGALEFMVLPSYGHYLGPMVQGGLAYALVETHAGLPSQIALAEDAYDNDQTINLLDGYLYQFSEGELTAQIAFTEVAFGTQGLVMGSFPEDFPPPPETYNPYPDYPDPVYWPPGAGTGTAPQPYAGGEPATGPIDTSLPQGTLVENIDPDRPRFNLEPVHDYDYPVIQRIGLVAFQESADIDGYGAVCDEIAQEVLGDVDGIEIVYIPWDSAQFGGAVMYDRAAWLCSEYGVDAMLISELDELENPGGVETARSSGSARVNVDIKSSLIDGVGGSTVWEGEFESERIHDYFEVADGLDSVLRSDISYVIRTLVDDLISSEALDGGHVD